MQAEYHLLKDPEVIMIISDMKQKLQKKHCENDRDAYDLLLFKAKSCIRSYDYICADKLFSDAVNVVYRHIPCNLNVYEAYESRDKYQPPINYQKLFEEAAYYYQKKNYMQFLKEYYAAESFYTALNIQSWGLKHIPLFDYILRKDDIPLMIAAVAFYTDYNENAPALNMLKLLKSRNFPSEQTKSLQEKLAVKMAKNDRETGKALKPKNNLISYTGKTKWFKYFNRKYRKELKLNIFSNLFGHYKLSRR
jgi:hypothetical protein